MYCYETTATASRATMAGLAGGQPGFEALFHQHRGELQRFLFHKLRSHEDAEDAVTQTFYKAWRARETFRGDVSDKSWLYRIASRVALDTIRGRRCASLQQDLASMDVDLHCAPEARPADPQDVMMESERITELQVAVREAVERLPEDQQQLLSLYYFDGLNYDQIADMLGIPYTKVRGRLYRIRQLVRRDMELRQRWQPA